MEVRDAWKRSSDANAAPSLHLNSLRSQQSRKETKYELDVRKTSQLTIHYVS